MTPRALEPQSSDVMHRSFGAVETSSELFITSESTEGSLSDLVKSSAELPFSRRLEIALDAARGLAYLHSRSPPVLHSNVKGCARQRGGKGLERSDSCNALELRCLRLLQCFAPAHQGHVCRNYEAKGSDLPGGVRLMSTLWGVLYWASNRRMKLKL